MEYENTQIHEAGPKDPSSSASNDIKQSIREGLYVLVNKKARTLLDLGGGNIASGAICIGWERNTDVALDHQLWKLKQVDSEGSYRLMSFRGATFLDLELGKQEDGSRVCAYNHSEENNGRFHQEWRISEEQEGYYTLQCARTGTYLEIQEGKPDNGINATCSRRAVDGDHQIWYLERVCRTTLEIKAILSSWKTDLSSRLFQPHGNDHEYFVLPSNLRNTIWKETKLLRQLVRKGTFDYDSFVIKARDAINTRARDRFRVDGYSVLFGIIFGEARKGPKAYNWYLSPDMTALVFFDAQTGNEYTTGGLDDFGFEPSFIMF